jgi:hypothetical protein
MRLRQFTLLLLFMLMLACAACGSPNRENTPGDNKACARTPSFIQPMDPPPSPPYPWKATVKAASYEDISAKLMQFSAEVDDTNYVSIKGKTDDYLHDSLQWKRVSGWQGWVVSTGIEARRSLETGESMGYEIDDDPDMKASMILLSMEDPLAELSERPVISTTRPSSFEKPYVALADIRESSGRQLCIGQKVSVEGFVAEAPKIIYHRGDIIVSDAVATIVEDALPERTVVPDLEDVMIKLRRIPGWSGPDYKLMVFGDGTVVFEGRYGTVVDGFRLATVSEERVRELLGEFEKAEFSSMTDHDERGVSDAPYVRTTLVKDGKRKSVLHYYGNNMPAEKLEQLENNIDKIIETDKWVGKN